MIFYYFGKEIKAGGHLIILFFINSRAFIYNVAKHEISKLRLADTKKPQSAIKTQNDKNPTEPQSSFLLRLLSLNKQSDVVGRGAHIS